MNTDVMFSSKTDQYETPQDLFDELDREFDFTLDPCADKTNHKCDKYYTKDQDGLSQYWKGERVFCNPPYGREIGSWVRKCYLHSKVGNGIAVMLIPSRTDTKWFHEYIYNKKNVEVRFLKGRLKFGGSKSPAPFPSMIVIFGFMNNELKSCPICGGKAEIYEQKHREYPSTFYVHCKKYCIRQRDYNDKEMAIEAWNNRV